MTPSAVNHILEILASGDASAYFGEEVTQLEHALQSAECARRAGADDDLIVAALLHDIGHLLQVGEELGVIEHDEVGAAHLRELGLKDRIVDLVGGHVQAKRYLTATIPAYRDRLSEASKLTLLEQGGPMTEEEVHAFKQDPIFREKLRLRSWDEQAKVPGLQVAALDSYRSLLQRS